MTTDQSGGPPPPFPPRRYAAGVVTSIHGDQYAMAWVQEPFRRAGIQYQASDPKGSLYISFLPMLNSRQVKLLGNRRLVNQLLGLERTTARGSGRDTIDHLKGGFDDVINACAGALLYATVKRPFCRVGTYSFTAMPGHYPGVVWEDDNDKCLHVKYTTVDEKTGKVVRGTTSMRPRDRKWLVGGRR